MTVFILEGRRYFIKRRIDVLTMHKNKKLSAGLILTDGNKFLVCHATDGIYQGKLVDN